MSLLALVVPPVHAATNSPLDIKHLSLEQLMEIDVYSVSRRLEPYQTAPSAIYVLTAEEIRRSRVTSIPEALRLVPGVQVARIDSNKWAVSIRGFNSRTSNKLLVVIDGHSIYDPLFSGVLWESRDVLIEDIDRIEVVRGPGGTLWGANAVNGVINIVTKRAHDTQGGLAIVRAGTEERAMGGFRYGWQPAKDQDARVYVKAYERDTGYVPSGSAHDGISSGQTGFRWDWTPNTRDELRISGDYFDVTAEERNTLLATQNVAHQGSNLSTRWKRSLADAGTLRAVLNYDHFQLNHVQLGEKRDTYEFEVQHGFIPAPHHQFTWGVDYRLSRDDLRNGPILHLDPSRRNAATAGVFVQDTLGLFDELWHLTAGTKFERNDYSGTEWQPGLRVSWTPDTRRTAWASAARAVRVPSRLETDLVLNNVPVGKGFDSERLNAYELGYRQQLNASLWYDVSLFHNSYRSLLSKEQFSTNPLDFAIENQLRGYTRGMELAARWKPSADSALDVSYSFLQMSLHAAAGSFDTTSVPSLEGASPRHQLVLRGAFDLQDYMQFDGTLRFVDKLAGPAPFDVPAYTELNLGLTWLAQPGLDISLVGQNLLHDHHAEQSIASLAVTEAERGVYLKSSWSF
ncbi:MAG: TonB-dependent receptor [Gammaproteobacteria bacterium]|nr:TonB-dependent receptor [Gammaproteobacteria bacterium]